ncbi:MAG: histidine kinase [Bacteroidota bacterium]|nr:histidine kinase [Bacteroidota bacterium]
MNSVRYLIPGIFRVKREEAEIKRGRTFSSHFNGFTCQVGRLMGINSGFIMIGILFCPLISVYCDMLLWFRKFGFKEVYLRWAGIPVLGLIISVFTREPHESFLTAFLISTTFTAFFWNGCYIIFILFRKQYPLLKDTAKRLFFTTLSVSAFLIIFDPIICLIFGFKSVADINNAAIIFDHSIINFLAAVIVSSFYENAYFFEKWKLSIQQNEALKSQQIRTQFEVLQNQMSPHFLFNSLNALTTLIAEDAQLAIKFTEKLSEVYRYILQNKEKELVKLEEEMDFVKNYIFLLQIRYPENLKVHFDIDPIYLKTSIAPLTIQILVENATKHNAISKTHPLQIEIYVENGKSIVVKNNLQLKKVLEKSTKTGLKNIQKRYAYLGQHQIDVITTAKNFMVAVPLLHIHEEKHELSPA